MYTYIYIKYFDLLQPACCNNSEDIYIYYTSVDPKSFLKGFNESR